MASEAVHFFFATQVPDFDRAVLISKVKNDNRMSKTQLTLEALKSSSSVAKTLRTALV